MDQDHDCVAAFVHRCFQVHSISFDDFPPTPRLSDDGNGGLTEDSLSSTASGVSFLSAHESFDLSESSVSSFWSVESDGVFEPAL